MAHLIPISVKVEEDLHTALVEFAKAQGVSVAAAARLILSAKLKEDGFLDSWNLKAAGYNDGLRKGLNDLRIAVAEVANKLFK